MNLFNQHQTWYDNLMPEDFSSSTWARDEEIEELNNQLKNLKTRADEEKEDIQKFIRRHLNALKKEIYGNDPIDPFKLDSAICNIAWVVDQINDSNRKVNVQRKGE